MILHYLLVTIQFAGIAFFVVTGTGYPQNILVLALEVVSVVIGVWAVIAMKLHTVTALPSVRPGGQLCTSGPYRVIRHPMYTAVLMLLLALLINDYSHIRMVVLLIVCVALFVKMNIEEKILIDHYAGYQAYMKKTKRIVPLVY
jgi:protein-S-isoprenylcysteine O-methyltransferase Ste14